jgi:nicotinamidase-related amidase
MSVMLFDRAKSCLIVIDVQQYFLDKLPSGAALPLVARIAWLVRAARALEIPVIATAEDIAANGNLVPDLLDALGRGQPVFDKLVFGLFDQGDIRTAVEQTGRREFVLAGLETDVCIAHSALGLAAAGYRVAVIDDACASPPPHHDAGLRRLRDAGVTVTTVKGIYYEWLRDLAQLKRVKPAMGNSLPTGLTL